MLTSEIVGSLVDAVNGLLVPLEVEYVFAAIFVLKTIPLWLQNCQRATLKNGCSCYRGHDVSSNGTG